MNVNHVYNLGPASGNVYEQIVSIREYRAINRYVQNHRSERIAGTSSSRPALSSKASKTTSGSGHYSTSQEAAKPSIPVSSSEFFDSFYIHNHMRIKSCQAKYKIGQNQLPTNYNRADSGMSNLDKADMYEMNTHQVISLKGIRVNHSG